MHASVENDNAAAREMIPLRKQKTRVSVVVISYNQEQYIAECLEGIFKQTGDFTMELVIGDDCSTDATLEVIKNYVSPHPRSDVEVKLLSAGKNIGMTKNLQRCLRACSGDFIAVCEGDDYWTDPLKLQKQVRFLETHPECSLCFHKINIYFQNTGQFVVFEPHKKLIGNVFTTRDLLHEHFIGNLSCCMYDAKYMQQVSDDLFELFIGDWMFNIYYSRFGQIGYLEEVMSVYRKHDGGAWGNELSHKQARRLHSHINAYNKFLNYEFDQEFRRMQEQLKYVMENALLDLAIIDDVAPHPLSAFRMQEFLSYLKTFPNSAIYCSGLSIRLLGDTPLEQLVDDFARKYPEFSGQIQLLQPDTVIRAKLIYMTFLGNTYVNIDRIERAGTPFVFCLYPGGMFGLNNETSDALLRRVTSSPCFRKVIVTQKITYDYLIEKQFCKPEQIEFIFGVVTPLEQIEKEYAGKKRFGIDKDTLDICFVAHKYTETGIDKGYDVFVDVALALSERYPNIRFHVVGGFDETVLDVRRLGGKIQFYGTREIGWFDDFYRDKDIILSPNIPFKIFDGSFDGFPTGSCTDAGLRETAIFCTDELQLNDGFFADGEELVVVPHDAEKIIEIIEFYYSNPEELAKIGKNGRRKIKQLYSYEAQMLPRITLLQNEIERFEQNQAEIREKFNAAAAVQHLKSSFFRKVKEIFPAWLKNGIKRILPEFMMKMYKRFSA